MRPLAARRWIQLIGGWFGTAIIRQPPRTRCRRNQTRVPRPTAAQRAAKPSSPALFCTPSKAIATADASSEFYSKPKHHRLAPREADPRQSTGPAPQRLSRDAPAIGRTLASRLRRTEATKELFSYPTPHISS